MIMHMLLLTHSWRLQSFPVLNFFLLIWDSNRSSCFDETFSWSMLIGAVQPWIMLLLISLVCGCVEESNNVMECFDWLVHAIDMFELLGSLLNMSIFAGSLAFCQLQLSV